MRRTKLPRCHALHPADPVVLRLFADLQIANWAREHEPAKRELADAFERRAWTFLINYLTGLELPDAPSFNRLG